MALLGFEKKKKKALGVSFFERYLTIWVILCMVVGVPIMLMLVKVANKTRGGFLHEQTY